MERPKGATEKSQYGCFIRGGFPALLEWQRETNLIPWIPACAGMTNRGNTGEPRIPARVYARAGGYGNTKKNTRGDRRAPRAARRHRRWLRSSRSKTRRGFGIGPRKPPACEAAKATAGRRSVKNHKRIRNLHNPVQDAANQIFELDVLHHFLQNSLGLVRFQVLAGFGKLLTLKIVQAFEQ